MPIIGIQDGSSDGLFDAGFDFSNLNEHPPGRHYYPYWIAEVSEQDWKSWEEFIGEESDKYTGRNYATFVKLE